MTTEHLPTLLSWFDDHISFSEAELMQTLVQLVAEYDAETCEILLRSLVAPPSNICRPVLELLLASCECRDVFWTCLVNDFPVIPDYFSVNLTAIMVLKKISFSVPFLHAFDRETNLKLNNYAVKLRHAPEVIEALSRFIDTSGSTSQEMHDDDQPFWRVKQTQRSRKNARTRPAIFDASISKACELLNISIPTTITDAKHDRHALTEELSTIFKSYRDLLQDPDVESTIRHSFIQVSVAMDFPSAPEIVTKIPEISLDGNQSVNSAFPLVQPMKAALYFESAEGFGEWRILISTRADRDLRDARRRDKKFFTIIVKKIKELSNGHFSNDNQKWLCGSQTTEIPIYEAKMTRDSRLIYQIDCIPEYDTDVERQVVKIFGVYTHAQIDKRLWGSLSHQLMKRGHEYRRRCCFRNQLVAGDKHFSPGCFPPIEQGTEENDQVVPTIPTENLEEIHSLLVLEKFITFSQALLNSIIADLDIAHVFDVSPGEMEIIQHPHSCYVLGRSGTGKTTTMLFKMLGIQRAYEQCKDNMQKPKQIFVTQSRVLAVKVEEYFSKLLDSLSTGQKTKEELAIMIKSKRQQQQDRSLVDVDDDQNWRPDLPLKYSDLQDEHFPLFLTFDRLTSLLEADFGIITDPDERRLLTYDRFLDAYWPHFSQPLKKGLDPALVYSEIIGVIEGSEESLGFDSQHLDKETYESLSTRTQYAFASQRHIIYTLFQSYQKRKSLFADLDAADRTHRILHEFQSRGVPGDRFDYLYVDEAQDNLLIDALLLRSLVRNPNGMFWAGDTAQTISLGSSFRFNDLKAFLFRLEKRRETSMPEGPSLIQEEPKSFHLTKNYRSHGGIVRCAQSVIELITNFWPNAIDVLSREVGVVDGCKPVFFSGWDSSTVRYEQFLFGESGNPVEFGAQQCILVRNEAAREELRSQVGTIGLILTLYESKGLEFDDVLLYKFFEDSSSDLSQWRIVLNMLNEEDGVVVSAPTFDNTRHAGVCTELKFLYVAITRARKNLWIVDCSENSEPMRVVWSARNEIQCCTPGSDVPRLAVSSTPQEWEETGRTLFTNKRYSQAMHCFVRAGLDREAAVAHAYFLREDARATARHDSSKQSVIQYQRAFCAAANAFLTCARSAINSKERATFLRNAAECLERADEDFRAAEVYKQAREFTKAAKLYRKTAKFDEAIAIVTKNRSQVAEEVAENIIGVAKLFYFKSGELEKASQLFESVEEQLQYLEDFDLDVSRAALYEKIGDLPAAAGIHLTEGRTLDAIRLFLKDSSNPISILRGKECILHGLWENLSFGTKFTEGHDEVRELLTLTSNSLKPHEKSEVGDELSMFMSLQSRDIKGLCALGTKFASQENFTSALFCLDHAFNSLPILYGRAAFEVSQFLQDFLLFCQTLYRLASIPNPGQDPKIRQLFRILSSTSGHFLLPVDTFLFNEMRESRVVSVIPNERGALISEGELARGFKSALLRRLRSKLEAEGDICKQATAFQPCLPFTINGHCNRRNCPNEHPTTNPLGEEWVLLRIKIHLQQLLVMQGLLLASIPSEKRIRQLRWWISSLFSTLFPPMDRLGHFANLTITRIPEALKAFPVIEGYCKDLIYWQNYTPEDHNLLTTSYQVARIAFFLNRTQAHPVILRSPLNALLNTIPSYRRSTDGIFHPILPELLCALNGTDTRGTLFGIHVLDHILQKLLPIDANVLMDLIDIICGSLILLRKNGNLHNVTLPLSTFNNLVNIIKIDLDVKPSNITAETNVFILSLKHLLAAFVSHQQRLGHLLHERSNLYDLVAYRPVFISRICRAMCLVGYNVNNPNLRENIISSIKTLKNLKPTHNLFKDYALVWHWSDITRTLTRSVSDTPLDQMIQLYHASESINAKPAPRNIRRIIYKNVGDIPKLLDGSLAFSTLRPEAPTFVPKRLAEVPVPDSEEGELEVEEPEMDNTDIINSAPLTESIAVTEIPDDNHPALEEQSRAARVLQTVYRRKLREVKYRKNNHRVTVLDASRSSCFQQCLAEASQMDWPKGSYYRLLFLGPLPHLQVCLNTAFDWVMENKQRNKKRFRSAIHQELDDINKRLTEQKKIIDELKILQKAINPQSQLHRRRDTKELGEVVLQVQEMLGRVAPGVAKDVHEDMQMAIKGIVTKKAPKKKLKPVLNYDDGHHDVDTDDEF